ncbi:MAG: DUF488 family protein [Chloroflexota bacterium]
MPTDVSAPSRIVYTLGTGRRSEEDFIEILSDYGIEAVIDVRRFPTSKLPHFSRQNLQPHLQSEGIGYFFLGEDLGGFRKGGYERYASGEEFMKGIDKVEDILRSACAVIICAERFPWKCHRRWIARELSRRGWHVIHIVDKGKTWEPQ